MRLTSLQVSIEDILLDPNNYRFHDIPTWTPVDERRYHEQRVQEAATRLLRSNGAFEVSQLKDSIRTNGFVPLEQVVVTPYPHLQGKYLVVEGNRRICAIKWLIEDHEAAAVTLTADQIAGLTQINVLNLDRTDPSNASATEVIMAIRHVAGIKEWGAYQQARLIVNLLEQQGATFQTVGERLGISSREVARRYRASRALKQMEEDPEFGDYARPTMYSIFHEVVATPAVREWLGWNDQDTIFTNAQATADLYGLMTGDEPKIRSYEDVRSKLKHIVGNAAAIQVLLDPGSSLDDAYQTAMADARAAAGAADFNAILRRTIAFLENLPRAFIRQMSEVQVQLLRNLDTQLRETIEDVERLRGNQGDRQAG